MIRERCTPLMRQFFEIKDHYKDSLLLFQVGDFYELFFEDAKMASSMLNLILDNVETCTPLPRSINPGNRRSQPSFLL